MEISKDLREAITAMVAAYNDLKQRAHEEGAELSWQSDWESRVEPEPEYIEACEVRQREKFKVKVFVNNLTTVDKYF